MKKAIDLTGMKFERLTVICRDGTYISPSGSKKVTWKCVCDCGNETVVTTQSLKNGSVKSCGCYNIDILSKRMSKFNEYDLTNKYGIGYTLKNEPFYFDLEDYDKIKDYCWYIDNAGYVVNKKDDLIYMHRYLMITDENSNMLVDHINHDKNDNRKSNLRIVTYSQNHQNKNVKGYCYDKLHNKWVSSITIDGYSKGLGYFDTKEEAVKARREAEEKYYGEYSYTNSMKISSKILEENINE